MLAKFERPTSRLLTLTNSRNIFCQVDTLGYEMNCLRGSEGPATGHSSQRWVAMRKVTDCVTKKVGEGRVCFLFKSSTLLRIFLSFNSQQLFHRYISMGNMAQWTRACEFSPWIKIYPTLLTSDYPSSCLVSPQQCECAPMSYSAVTEWFKISYH